MIRALLAYLGLPRPHLTRLCYHHGCPAILTIDTALTHYRLAHLPAPTGVDA